MKSSRNRRSTTTRSRTIPSRTTRSTLNEDEFTKPSIPQNSLRFKLPRNNEVSIDMGGAILNVRAGDKDGALDFTYKTRKSRDEPTVESTVQPSVEEVEGNQGSDDETVVDDTEDRSSEETLHTEPNSQKFVPVPPNLSTNRASERSHMNEDESEGWDWVRWAELLENPPDPKSTPRRQTRQSTGHRSRKRGSKKPSRRRRSDVFDSDSRTSSTQSSSLKNPPDPKSTRQRRTRQSTGPTSRTRGLKRPSRRRRSDVFDSDSRTSSTQSSSLNEQVPRSTTNPRYSHSKRNRHHRPTNRRHTQSLPPRNRSSAPEYRSRRDYPFDSLPRDALGYKMVFVPETLAEKLAETAQDMCAEQSSPTSNRYGLMTREERAMMTLLQDPHNAERFTDWAHFLDCVDESTHEFEQYEGTRCKTLMGHMIAFESEMPHDILGMVRHIWSDMTRMQEALRNDNTTGLGKNPRVSFAPEETLGPSGARRASPTRTAETVSPSTPAPAYTATLPTVKPTDTGVSYIPPTIIVNPPIAHSTTVPTAGIGGGATISDPRVTSTPNTQVTTTPPTRGKRNPPPVQPVIDDRYITRGDNTKDDNTSTNFFKRARAKLRKSRPKNRETRGTTNQPTATVPTARTEGAFKKTLRKIASTFKKTRTTTVNDADSETLTDESYSVRLPYRPPTPPRGYRRPPGILKNGGTTGVATEPTVPATTTQISSVNQRTGPTGTDARTQELPAGDHETSKKPVELFDVFDKDSNIEEMLERQLLGPKLGDLHQESPLQNWRYWNRSTSYVDRQRTEWFWSPATERWCRAPKTPKEYVPYGTTMLSDYSGRTARRRRTGPELHGPDQTRPWTDPARESQHREDEEGTNRCSRLDTYDLNTLTWVSGLQCAIDGKKGQLSILIEENSTSARLALITLAGSGHLQSGSPAGSKRGVLNRATPE
ncbi:hypothetical protein TREMEDRAFT_64817 [Tremella mesenterica DSM 1558]|uniref:uncharacterized protein n=1 Tax=Tremella mesenterica (strain ATCC 24925 / CBS 8224 / DSM 1558 / NBRC 9311 / NRRL Y-6157 / RJB 2259-6 / UBC 559-6) TaxID=578456 RepID=UPI0003F49041|nr:uncharacterized protein TREMEDRAFT_64817 [Tremella mesenterica DSM 1558]EIW66957.1 hypothetical protein TREMEDRAFT_64817 [Tremella mesenterica DSM 1558]